MRQLRVVETYVSYQGEGPNTSKPTVFVRFAGCNFKCPGWPCDTQHAIDPQIYRGLQVGFSGEELAEKVHDTYGVTNICLTGGEVFLQNKDELGLFVQRLHNLRHHVECFTNGALEWPETVSQYIDTFILDWKLPGSGETYTTKHIMDNVACLGDSDAIKFTLKDEEDYIVAKERWKEWIRDIENPPQVFAGVVWDGPLTTEKLCDLMMRDRLPWNLNVQVHKYVWNPNRIGV